MKQLISFVLFFIVSLGIVSAQILSGNPTLPQLHASTLVWGDYDLDGKPDLLIMGTDSLGRNSTHLLRNQINTFTAINHPFPSLSEPAAAWLDVDADGDLDLLIAGRRNRQALTQLWINTAGAFSLSSQALPQFSHAAIRIADLDGDGDSDVLIAGMESNVGFQITVLRNNAGQLQTFQPSAFQNTSLRQVQFSLVNFIGDPLPEIILQGLDDLAVAHTQIWLNTGNLQFVPYNCTIPGYYGGNFSLADTDNDGDLDVLVCGMASGPRSGFYRNDSTLGLINETVTGLIDLGYGEVHWRDFNQDGIADIFCGGRNTSGLVCKLLRGQPGFTFTDNQPNSPLPALENPHFAIADWNGDGFVDVAISGTNALGRPVLSLYRWDNLLSRLLP